MTKTVFGHHRQRIACGRRLGIVCGLVVLLLLSYAPSYGQTANPALTELDVNIDQVFVQPDNRPVVTFFVTVTDPDGLPVTGLSASGFTIKADGHLVEGPVEAGPFVATDRQLSFILLLEFGENMGTSLTYIQKSALNFVNRMSYRYRGTVIGYSGAPTVLAGFDSGPEALKRAVADLEPVADDSTPVAALDLALKKLSSQRQSKSDHTRQALVIFCGGFGGLPEGRQRELEKCVFQNNIETYALGYGREDDSGLEFLKGLCLASGGYYFFADYPQDLERGTDIILERLMNRYVVSFAGEDFSLDGSAHQFTLTINQGQKHGQTTITVDTPYRKEEWPRKFRSYITAGLMVIVVLAIIMAFKKGRKGKGSRKKRR